MSPLADVLRGSLVTCWIAGLVFFRAWRSTRDRLFLFFTASFWVFSLNWLGLVFLPGPPESRHLLYLLRLLAFGILLAGIWDKNRRERRARPDVRSPVLGRLPAGAAHRSRGQ